MDRFYCPDLSANSTEILLDDAEAHHASRVLRKKQGDSIELINGRGLLAYGTIAETGKRRVRISVTEMSPASPSPPRAAIAIATIRPNRMDWLVEKLTELGVSEIQPLFTEFTSVRTFKSDHLQKIAVSALKQSLRLHLPVLCKPLDFQRWLANLPANTARFIAHREAVSRSAPPVISGNTDGWICAIGPEGGFSGAEINAALAQGFQPLHLNDAILRSETAAIAAAVLLKSAAK